MLIQRLALALLLFLSSVTLDSTPVWAIEPITDAMLDKADSDAKDVIARAEAAGNAVAKAVGEQVLKAIEALRQAIHSSIGDAKEAYLQSQRETYDNISKLLDQAQDLEKVSMTDVTTLLATISNEVGNLPFINMPPYVMLYQPHVLVPEGPSETPVRVIGPRISASDPTVTFDGTAVQLQKSRDVEFIALLDRKTMTFEEREPRYVPVKIKYDQAQSTWWKPWTWFAHDFVTRDMTLLLLPKIMGSYTIETKVNSVDYVYKPITRHAGGHGHDNSMDIGIAPDPADVADHWQVDVSKLRDDKGNATLKFWRTGGDEGASCGGLLTNTLTPNGFSFRLVHGHKTDGWGKKSDVDVQCDMTVPLVKATPITIDGPTLQGDIDWQADKRQPLPANLASYVLSLKLFNSKEYILDADTKAPYGLVEITRRPEYVQFRPVPPADF